MIGLLLDLGNVAITIANVPQILIGYMVAAGLFLAAGLLAGGYLTVALCSFNQAFYAVQLYWKLKYGRQLETIIYKSAHNAFSRSCDN